MSDSSSQTVNETSFQWELQKMIDVRIDSMKILDEMPRTGHPTTSRSIMNTLMEMRTEYDLLITIQNTCAQWEAKQVE